MKDKEIINLITDSGRANDTVVAHLSPDAVNVLKIEGGVGAINPDTGLQEYWGFSDFVRVFVPVAIVAVAIFAPEIIPAIGAELGFAAGSTEAAAAGSAVLGASSSAVTTIANGGNAEETIKSAGIGAVSGGVGGAVGAEVSGAVGAEAGGAIAGPTAGGAASGATRASLTGQDVSKGAAAGAVSGAVTSGVSEGLKETFGGTAPDYLKQPAPFGTSTPTTTDETGTYQFGSPKNIAGASNAAGFGYQPDPSLTPPSVGGYTGTTTPDTSYSEAISKDISPQIPKAETPTPLQKEVGILTSSILTPKIISGIYGTPTSSPSTSFFVGGGDTGGTNTALLGQALGTTSDTSLIGSPIMGSEDSGQRSRVWNTESLRNALGIA